MSENRGNDLDASLKPEEWEIAKGDATVRMSELGRFAKTIRDRCFEKTTAERNENVSDFVRTIGDQALKIRMYTSHESRTKEAFDSTRRMLDSAGGKENNTQISQKLEDVDESTADFELWDLNGWNASSVGSSCSYLLSEIKTTTCPQRRHFACEMIAHLLRNFPDGGTRWISFVIESLASKITQDLLFVKDETSILNLTHLITVIAPISCVAKKLGELGFIRRLTNLLNAESHAAAQLIQRIYKFKFPRQPFVGVERTLFMQEVESAKEAFRKQKSTRELRKKLLLLHVELHKIMTGEDGYSAFLDRDRTIIVFCGSLIPLLFHITTTLRRSCSSVDDEENKSIREARNEARRSLLQLVLHISETPSLRLHLLQNPWTVPSLQSLLIPSQDEDTFLDCEWSLAVVHSLSMAVETEMHRYEGEDDNDIHIDVKKNWGPNYIITRLRPILVNLISLAANPGQFCDTNERLRLRRAVWSVFSRLCVSKSFGANATIEILSNGTLEKFVNDISDECKHAHVAGLLAITTFRAASEEKKVRSEVLSMCLDSVRTLCGLIEFEESAPEYRLEETEMLDIMQRVATLDSSPPLTKDTIVRMGDFVFHAMRYGHTEDSERRGKMIASVLRWMLQTKQGLENLKDRAPIFVRNLCLVLRRCLVENYISFDTIAIQTTCDALHIIALHDNKSLAHLVRADVITILSKVQSMVETSEDCGLDSMLRLITALVPLCDATCSTEQGRVFVCPRNDNTTSKFMDVTMELVVPDLLRMIGTHPRKSTFDLLARLACSDSSTDIILKLDNEISTFLIETFMTTNDLPTSFMTLLGELCRSRDVRRRVMKRDGMFQRLVTMYGNIATKMCKDVIRDDQLYEFASSLALIFCRLAMDGRENDRSDPAVLIGRSGLLVHFLRVGSRAASFYRSFVGNDKFDDTTPIFRAQLQSLCVLAVCFARSFLVPYALKMSSENLVKIFCDLSVILRGTGNSNEGVTRYRGPDRFLRCDLCRVVTALVVRSIILFPGSMGQWHHELHKANMLKTLQDVGRCYAISLRSEYGHYALDHLARDGATVLAKTSPSSSLKLEETEMIQPSRMIMTDPILSSPSPKRRDQQPLKRLRRRRLPEKIDTRLAHSVGRALEIMNVVDMKTGSPKKGRHGSRSSSCRRRRSPKKR